MIGPHWPTRTVIDEEAAARHDPDTCRFCDPDSEDYIDSSKGLADADLEDMRHRLRMGFE